MREPNIVKRLLTVIAIVAMSAPAVASTSANDGLKGQSVKVSYADLNLQKEAGAKALYRRLQQASKKACGVASYRHSGSLKAKSESIRCYQNSLTSSVAKVDSALLTKIHES